MGAMVQDVKKKRVRLPRQTRGVSTTRKTRELHLASRKSLKTRPHTAPHLEQADAIVDLGLAQAELPEDGTEHHSGAEVSDHLFFRRWWFRASTEEKQANERRVNLLTVDGMVVSRLGDCVLLSATFRYEPRDTGNERLDGCWTMLWRWPGGMNSLTRDNQYRYRE